MDAAAGACAHCGLPLPRPPAASEAHRADRPAFCCTGCHVAHSLALRDPEGRTDRWLARVVLSAFLSMGVMVFSLSLYGVYLDPAAGEHGPAAEALTGVFRMGALALSLPVMTGGSPTLVTVKVVAMLSSGVPPTAASSTCTVTSKTWLPPASAGIS